MNNTQRAERIGPIDSDKIHNGDDNDAQTNAGDHMANFFHWCTQHRVDPMEAMRRGYYHYREEAFGSDGEEPYSDALLTESQRVLQQLEAGLPVGD